LRSVIKAGHCTLSEWKPYSAMAPAQSRLRTAL
jgi:hypothetical protein